MRDRSPELNWKLLDQEGVDNSMRLLMKSLWTIWVFKPRVWRMENVGGAPMEEVLTFVADELPCYEVGLFRCDGADVSG